METDAKNLLGMMGKPVEAKDIPITNPLGIGSVYANDFGLAFTSSDIRFIFSEVGADITSNTPSKILKANVVVPLMAGEAFAQQVLALIEQHKKNLEALMHGKEPGKS